MGRCPSAVYFICGLCLATIVSQVCGEGMKCSGYCTKDIPKCQLRGGKVIGYCTKNLVCCDPVVSATGSCGESKSDQQVVFFESPSFPAYAGGDLVCDFTVRIRNDTEAIRVDFLKVEMDGLSFDGAGENMASCESDMIFIRGFNTWSPPARCGNLTGYGVVIDIDTKQTRNLGALSIVALMSSPKYRFHMRIAQVSKGLMSNSIVKRSAPRSILSPVSPPTPTRQLIKTGRPAILPRSVILDSSPLRNTEEDGKKFKIFESEYPTTNWNSPSIVNGEDTLISTVPWQVSLRIKPGQPPPEFVDLRMENMAESNDDTLVTEDDLTLENDTYSFPNCSESEGTHFCGGSILDNRHVLSAAHCFFGSSKVDGMLNVSSIMVVVGDTNKCSDDEEGIFSDQQDTRGQRSFRYDVESIVFHYGYDHSLLINDVAVLRLNQTIKYYDHVRPIPLASPGDTFESQTAILSGWGDRFTEGNSNNYSSEEPQGPSILQSSRLLQIQNQSFCNARDMSQFAAPKPHILSHAKYLYVFESTICTLTKNGSKIEVNTGRGDSGGPLIVFRNTTPSQQPVLVGVVSYSIPFDEKVMLYDGVNRTVDFYTSVAFFRGWIDLVIKSFQFLVSYKK